MCRSLVFTEFERVTYSHQPFCKTVGGQGNLVGLTQGALPNRRHAPTLIKQRSLETRHSLQGLREQLAKLPDDEDDAV